MKPLTTLALVMCGWFLLAGAALAQNNSPILDPIGSQNISEGSRLDIRVTAADTDAGDIVSLSAELIPANATFSDSGSGVGFFVFTPDYSQAGNYQVRFIATDLSGAADSELVDIVVAPTDRTPVITPISTQSVAEGGHLAFRVVASDPDGDAIALTAQQIPTNAAFTDSTGGRGGFIFDPDYTQANTYQVRFIASSNTMADTELVTITVTGTDRAPVITPISAQSVAEGGHLAFRVVASDPDGDAIALTAQQVPTNAAFSDSANGHGGFIFDPDYTQANTYQVRFIASSNAMADTETVTVTVTNVDRAPIFGVVPAQSVNEGQQLIVNFSATDPDGDAIVLTSGTLPSNAIFSDLGGGAGRLTFSPSLTQEGHYDISFYAASGTPSLRDTLIVAIDVLHTNAAPVLAAIGSRSVNENQNLRFVATASDIDGQIPVLSAQGLPLNASFTDSLNGHGLFSFDPSFSQAGIYNVLFIATDGSAADSESVQITVNNTNRAPILNAIGTRSVIEGGTLNVRISSSDPDLQPLTLTALSLPTNAIFIDSTNGAGLFRFTPGYTQAGAYDIRFIVSDGTLADSELVRVTVLEAGNQAPVVDSIGPQNVVEGQQLLFLIHGHDPDGTIPIIQGFNLPANSAVADSGNGAASFEFHPTFVQAGVYNVLFRAFDGSAYDSLWVQVTVYDYGFAPVLNPIGPRAVTEGNQLQFVVTSTDPDGNFPHLSASPLPLHATFVDSLNGHGLFTFNPDYTQGNIYNILFIATDGAMSDSETVLVTVNDVGNLRPVLAPIGARTVNEGDSLIVNISATDPDGTFPIFMVSSLPVFADFIDNGNGTARFSFHPDYFEAGVYTLLFIATDGALADSEYVPITVNNVNRVPILSTIGSQIVSEGNILQFVVTSNDLDGQIPSLFASPLPANAVFTDSLNGKGLFSFQPNFSQAGVYNILFRASDGTLADSEMVQITVSGTNMPPVFASLGNQFVFEGNSLAFTVQASDGDGTNPSLTATGLPVHATFADNGNGTGSFQYHPDYTQAGVINVTFIASDGLAADTLIIQITTIDSGNQPPILALIGPQSVFEGATLSFNISASDADGSIPVLTADLIPANGSFTDNGNGTGSFNYHPDYAMAGIDSVLFVASDGIQADSEIVQITIINVNREPSINVISAAMVSEGDTLTFPVIASDEDNDILTLFARPLAANMIFTSTGNGSGNFVFMPNYAQSGTHVVYFVFSDSVVSDSQAVQITVSDAGNQAPVLAAIDTAYFVTEGASLQFNVAAADPDGSIPVLSAFSLAANMSFVDNHNGNGTFTFLPNFAQTGYYSVGFIASDGQYADTATTHIYVAEQGNQYPVLATIGPRTVAEGANLSFTISAADPEEFIPLLFIDRAPRLSTFVDNRNGTGSFTFNPDYYSAGSDTVRFIAMDNGGLIDYEDMVITVTDVNRAPWIIYRGDTIVTEGGTLVGTVTVYDSTDYQPGTLSLTYGYMPANGSLAITGNGTGTFTFHPDYNQAGVDSVYFVAVDSDSPPLSAGKWVRIHINGANRRPILQQPPPSDIDQGDTLVINLTATDADGDPITIFVNSNTYPLLPPNAEFHDLGGGHAQFIFRPDYTQSGLFIVSFGASDGHSIDSRSALIMVHDLGNQRPTLYPIGNFTITEGDVLELRAFSTDPDSSKPALSVVGMIAGMTFIDSTNGAGSFRYQAYYFQAGSYNLVFVASDGILSDSETVNLTVLEAGNQPPDLVAIGDRTAVEGTTLRFAVVGADPDSTIPVLQAHNLPANASFVDSTNGRGGFVFAPNFAQAGVYHVVFVAYDNVDPALADSQDVAITVTDYNRWPTIDPIGAQTVNEGANLTFTVTSHDPDSTIPILVAAHIPPNATFTDNNNGTGVFNFNPSYSQAGVDSARIVAVDRIDPGRYSVLSVRITILNVNRAPILGHVPNDTTIGDGFLLVINMTSSDPDSTFPILFQRGKPDSAIFVDNGNGTGRLQWRPRFSDIGNYNLILGCRDRANQTISDSELVVIHVISAGNHPPVFTQIPHQELGDGDTLRLNITVSDMDGDLMTLFNLEPLPFGLVFTNLGNGHGTIFWIPTSEQGGDTVVTLIASDPAGLTDTLRINITVTTFVRGDANGSGVLNGVDVVYLVNYFKGGPAPNPLESGDANGNGVVNGLDVVYLINYFKGGPPPPPMPPAGGQNLKLKPMGINRIADN